MSSNRASRRPARVRSQRGASEIAQFIPVLYILFLIFLMPMLDFGIVFVAGAIQYLATNDIAAKASTQGDYATMLSTVASEAYSFQSNGFSHFLHLQPAGGYMGCGNDLVVVATDTTNGTVTSSDVDQPLAVPISTKTNMYEISVKSVYNISPLVSLAAVPVLNQVPGLGKPMTLAFKANRPVEHPGGLGQALAFTGGGSITAFPRAGIPGQPPPSIPNSPGNTWRTPDIFQQIANNGQTVQSVNVVLVQSDCPTWTPTGVNIIPGEKIYVDTQAVGQWWTPGLPQRDANGIPNDPGCPGVECPAANFNALVGVVGVTGPIQANTPNSFFVGDQQLNMATTGVGPLMLANNNWGFNTVGTMTNGAQLVRVIVVK